MPDPLGDFQTPAFLASQVWRSLDLAGVDVFVEPTVGEGVFLETVPGPLLRIPWLAWDINPAYVTRAAKTASTRGLRATVAVQNAFDVDAASVAHAVAGKTVLAIGNPPWVTSAAQGSSEVKNLPRKWNRFGLRGLDAVTGKANFDIAEAALFAVIDALKDAEELRLAFLVKRSVALKMSRDILGSPGVIAARFSRIDARAHFGVSVEAGLFELVIRPQATSACTRLLLRPGLAQPTSGVAGIVDGRFVCDVDAYEAARAVEAPDDARLLWRQGIKHDLAKVLELRKDTHGLVNGFGARVDIEPEVLCPLFKSSDVASGRAPRRWFPLYQHDLSGPLPDLEARWPKLARYLGAYSDRFAARGSSIYRGKPDFMLFGVGDYTLAPYKVALSGFYKEPVFRVLEVAPQGNPPLVDDTCYLLPFERREDAERVAEYLNSERVQTFLRAVVDREAKRPFTKEVLSRIAAPPPATPLAA